MTKVIHFDFFTVAEAMCADFINRKESSLASNAFFGSWVGIVFAHAPEGIESTLHQAGI